ncbi:MAG: DUF5677 domain-containing protein [Nitrospirales bacterium]|nr:DUF5677 domain-containing protein [Nitrospirales bacterium]
MKIGEKVKHTINAELFESLKILRSILRGHKRLSEIIVGVLVGHPGCLKTREEKFSIEASVKTALIPTFFAFASSSKTIVELSKMPGVHTRDCFGIARAIIELGINICFILAEGSSAAEKALRHSRQKSYRNLERESKIGKLMVKVLYSGKKDITLTEIHEREIKEFTSKRGFQKNWIDLSLDERIETIGQSFGERVQILLQVARLSVYDTASEILHGTVFGAMYSLGLMDPPVSVSEKSLGNELGDKHFAVLFGPVLVGFAVEMAFHKKYGYKFLNDRSNKLWRKYGRMPFILKEMEAKKTRCL